MPDLRDILLISGVLCAVAGLALAVWDSWDRRRKK